MQEVAVRVLVMGGSRFNGLALVEALVAAGHDVTTFNRGMTNTELPRGVHQLHGDRKDAAGLQETLRGLDFDAAPTSSRTSRASSISSAGAPATTSSRALAPFITPLTRSCQSSRTHR
jgi:nucleoside-diphosphate-sugar epimerase